MTAVHIEPNADRDQSGGPGVVECDVEFWRENGPKLVAARPLREVRLLGVEPIEGKLFGFPWEWGRQGVEVHAFARGPGPHRWNLPLWLFRSLPRRKLVPEITCGRPRRGSNVYYPTRDAALAELSEAAIMWARQRAKVPDAEFALAV